MAKADKSGYLTSKGERASYGLYFLGQNIFYSLISGGVFYFLTDRGMDAAVIAIVMLVVKVWDSVNDPIFGVLMDKVKFKKGRFMPWLRISVIGIPIATLLIFFTPSINTVPSWVQIVWIILAYILWDTSYTVCDAPVFALATSMTDNNQERVDIISLGRLLATVGAIVVTAGLSKLFMSVDQGGFGLDWRIIAVGFSLVSVGLMVPLLFKGKERVNATLEKSYTFKEMFGSMFKNKYLMVYMICALLVNVTNAIQQLATFIGQDLLGDANLTILLMGAFVLPILLLAVFMPALTKKVDKMVLFIGSNIIFVVTSIMQYFLGYDNTALLIVMTALRGVGFSGAGVLIFMFAPDCVEYSQFKNGERAEGVTFSIQTFIIKLAGAVAGSIAMFILGAFGYISGEDAVQGALALKGIWLTFTLISAIGPMIAVPILIIFYKLRDKDVVVMTEFNQGKITREEAESRLSRKY